MNSRRMRGTAAGLVSILALALGDDPLFADDIDTYRAAGGAQPTACAGISASLVAGALAAGRHSHGALARDIYFNLFEPGAGDGWRGNIKKLKIATVDTAADMPAGVTPGESAGDAGAVIAQAPLTDPPVAAVSPQDGQILPDALTFWTDPAGADVLAFDPARGEVPGRDGRSVSRGGAGQQIPGYLVGSPGVRNSDAGARQLYTVEPTTGTALLPLDATPASLPTLGPILDPEGELSAEAALAVLAWVRGLDSYDADADGDYLEARQWLLADALHSRPLAVEYGVRPGTGYSAANPEVRLFYGSNDGFVHMLRNTQGNTAAAESGRETWAFMPPSLLAVQAARATGSQLPAGLHRYGMDGEAVAHVVDRDGNGTIEAALGDRVWVYIGQRRGGRSLFAFDMSDPDEPGFLWRINSTSAGFEQLALTFSTPRVAHLDLGAGTPTAVLIFGGGYNGGVEQGARVGKDAGDGADTVGNAIYVVDAATGALLWKAVGPGAAVAATSDDNSLFVPELRDSIPSALTVIDADHNGVDDRAYVGDSGGNVWRLDLAEHSQLADLSESAVTGSWRLRRLAVLGGSGIADRRFFHAPDVVQSRDRLGDYDGVVILSGNRAAPGDTSVRDYAYLLKDRLTAGAGPGDQVGNLVPIAHDHLEEIGAACAGEGESACDTGELANGWRLALRAPGEKGLSTPLVSKGTVIFTSYVPPTNGGEQSCTEVRGSTRVYTFSLEDGAPRMAPEGSLVPPPGSLEPAAEPVLFQDTGSGLPVDAIPIGDLVLLPGAGIAGDGLYRLPGPSVWRAYWRQAGIDEP